MNSTSPANSSISTTAIVGGGGGGGGSGSNAAFSADDLYLPSDLISVLDRKDDAMLGLLPFFHLLSSSSFYYYFPNLQFLHFFY